MLLSFLIGLAFGSFGTVLIERLPQGESLGGRSRCPTCRRVLRWWELVPVASFLLCSGHCRRCNAAIPSWYPLLECASGFLFLIAFFTFPAAAFPAGIALWLLLLIAVIDERTRALPDSLLAAFLLSALGVRLMELEGSIAGPLLGGLLLGAQWLLGHGKFVGSGDVIVALGIGILLRTWQETALALWMTYVIGGSIAALLLVAGKVRRGDHLPLAPFFCSGVLAAVLSGRTVAMTLFPW